MSTEAVESERASILRRLDAIDGRGVPEDIGLVANELKQLRADRDRLEIALVQTKAAAEAIAIGSAAALDSARAHLDAVQQFLTPTTVDG